MRNQACQHGVSHLHKNSPFHDIDKKKALDVSRGAARWWHNSLNLENQVSMP
jgi:hypothetical protein